VLQQNLLLATSLREGTTEKDIAINPVATPLLEECEDDIHTPEMGLGSLLGLPKLQSLITRVKTPHLEAFFMALESY
jgi:shikimate 5-dehydrogenase